MTPFRIQSEIVRDRSLLERNYLKKEVLYRLLQAGLPAVRQDAPWGRARFLGRDHYPAMRK